MSRLWIMMAATLVVGTAQAQHASPSPYSGLKERSIKALSDQQIADLRAGRGMGLALPAELNGYPGPIHVSGTRRPARADRGAAHPGTGPPCGHEDGDGAAGERLIAQETELDRLFATKSVTRRACRPPPPPSVRPRARCAAMGPREATGMAPMAATDRPRLHRGACRVATKNCPASSQSRVDPIGNEGLLWVQAVWKRVHLLS